MKRPLGFKKKLYGIDLDGVCFDFLGPCLEFMSSELHRHFDRNEVTSYYWFENEDVDLTEKEFWNEFHKFGKENHGYRRLPLLPGTIEALRAIVAAGHEICYITSRPEYALQDTIDALEEHDFPFRENLRFAKGKKTPIINELSVDVFIDDSPTTIPEITANTRATIYCRSYKCNEHLDETFFTRVYNWEEFLQYEGLSVDV